MNRNRARAYTLAGIRSKSGRGGEICAAVAAVEWCTWRQSSAASQSELFVWCLKESIALLAHAAETAARADSHFLLNSVDDSSGPQIRSAASLPAPKAPRAVMSAPQFMPLNVPGRAEEAETETANNDQNQTILLGAYTAVYGFFIFVFMGRIA